MELATFWSIPGRKHNYTRCLNMYLQKTVLTFLGRQNAVHYKFNNLTPHHQFSYSLITQVLPPFIKGRENQGVKICRTGETIRPNGSKRMRRSNNYDL